MLLGEEVNDYDFYFKSADTVRRVLAYYIGDRDISIKEEIMENIMGEEELRITAFVSGRGIYREPGMVITSNAISLREKGIKPVQLITRFYGSIEEVMRYYDFAHTKNWYDYNLDYLHLDKMALISLMSKSLHYAGSLYPLCSVMRIRKFMKRGWSITVGQMLKMQFQLQKIDLNDVEGLTEQLIGVDSLYALEFIGRLNDATDSERADAGYLATLLDSVFAEDYQEDE